MAVLALGDERVWSETLIDRLAQLRPEQYAELAALLKPFDITPGQVHGRLPDGTTANRRGVDTAQIRAAYHKRIGPGTREGGLAPARPLAPRLRANGPFDQATSG